MGMDGVRLTGWDGYTFQCAVSSVHSEQIFSSVIVFMEIEQLL